MKIQLLPACITAVLLASVASAQTTPAWQNYIKASNTDPGDFFGSALDTDGDVLVVGASRESSGATQVNGNQANNGLPGAGAAYVLRRSGSGTQTTWVQEAYLKASNAGASDWFGSAVAVSGDWIAVGAPSEDGAGTGQGADQASNASQNSGAVYIFRRVGTGAGAYWTQEAYLKPANNHAWASYGDAVALDNGLLVVGAHGDSSDAVGINGTVTANNEPSSGAAYVYRRTLIFGQPAWILEAYIKAPAPRSYDSFGADVDISGNRILVGAPYEDSSAVGINGQPNALAPDAGAAYLYATSGGGAWALSAFLKASNAEAGDRFGTSVAIDGTRVAVGAIAEESASAGVNANQGDNSLPAAGAAYLYSLHGGPFFQVWAQDAYLKAQYPVLDGYFGCSVALQGARLLVGSSGDNSDRDGFDAGAPDALASFSGAAYAYDWQIDPVQTAYVKGSYSDSGDRFGQAVAICGETMLVGADDSSAATGIDGDAADNSADSAGSVSTFALYADCDQNHVADVLEAYRDCDNDGLMDGCEIAAGASDCDGNTVPDSCQPDANADGIADACQGGVAYCFGSACPCGNNGGVQNGCGNSQNASGARLSSTGLPSVTHDSLVLLGSGMTASSNVLYFQGTAQGAGTAFGDGLRCATGSVVRLGTTNNVQGGSQWPRPGAAAIHIGGNIPATGGLRTYQAWYRDPSPAFCSASTFNLTNGVRVQWLP